jgi:asparagine synthase (glutamine-hydrolysing)
MAVGLELRVPLLDHVLVEAVVRLLADGRRPTRPKPLLLDAVDQLCRRRFQNAERGFTFPWDAYSEGRCETAFPGAARKDVWRAIGIAPEAPARLWTTFVAQNGRVGGLQIIALWVLREYAQRHGLVVA